MKSKTEILNEIAEQEISNSFYEGPETTNKRRESFIEGILYSERQEVKLAERIVADMRNKLGPVSVLLALLQETNEEHKDFIQEQIKKCITASEEALDYLRNLNIDEFKNKS